MLPLRCSGQTADDFIFKKSKTKKTKKKNYGFEIEQNIYPL
jgi:hypothetical protein